MKQTALPLSYRFLVASAGRAKRYSYSPYSRFRVGAALLTNDGRVYTGCNIENSSYGLTVCAERTAVFKAVSEGAKRFKAIAVVSDSPDITPPCGACRQVLLELAHDADVILVSGREKCKIVKMKELFPLPFSRESLMAGRGRTRGARR